jgi:hypothetical protein
VAAHALHQLPTRIRHLAIDERGVGLRATWRLERGFVNLSLWRLDRCVETFHLTPAEAGRLIGFLVEGLAGAVPAPQPPAPAPLTVVPAPADWQVRSRRRLAAALERTAVRLRR